ncbi:MAG TPA: 50S ribosomal protein L22 [Pyrinomonadaceae bacterium]|nr:50S ribosomal protein L22 [Pyrinomonadaceae bacterium]
MEAIAKGKFLRGSPQKTRLVIDMIRGKNVAHALAVLQFTNKRATENIEKCLRSAIANATFKAEQDNIAIDPDDLWVKTCFVDQGPSKQRRRVRPAPQGRAYREKRYYCHITIELSSEKPKSEIEKDEKINAAKARRAARKAETRKAEPAKTPKVATTGVTEDAPKEPSAAPAVTPAADSVEEIAGATTPIETTMTGAELEAEASPAATATDAPIAADDAATVTDGETTAEAENGTEETGK